MKFQWRATPRWVLLGSIERERQVYCILDPLVSKAAALRLLRHYARHFSTSPNYWLSVGGK